MKSKLFFSVVLIVVLVLGLAFVSCDNDTTSGGGFGTIYLYNESKYPNLDEVILVYLYTSSGSLFDNDNLQLNQSIRWNNVPTGSYYLRVVDGYALTHTSSTFTLSNGQTRSYSFNGDNIVSR